MCGKEYLMKNSMIWTFIAVLLGTNGLTADVKIGGRLRPDNPKMVRLPVAWPNGDEATMVIFNGRPLRMSSYRQIGGGEEVLYLEVENLVNSEKTPHFGHGFGFACAFVKGKELNIFATKTPQKEWPEDWTTDVHRFWTTDLKTWKNEMVLPRIGDKHILNTSVCKDPRGGYLMAYECDGPTGWETWLARSKDLSKWDRTEGLKFVGIVFANPTIRYVAPYYYLISGTHRTASPIIDYEYHFDSTRYITVLYRSKDLISWDLSPTKYPMLDAAAGEGINNTDADIFEYEGNTYIYYITGDQQSWGAGRLAMYAGSMKECLEAHFPKNTPMVKYDAKKAEFTYPPKKSD
jgi:hypothetical protein